MVQTLQALFAEIGKYPKDDVFVVGGAMMYRTLLPYCDGAIVTKADADGGAEVFFEDLDALPNWELCEASEQVETNGYMIRFCTYVNRAPQTY